MSSNLPVPRRYRTESGAPVPDQEREDLAARVNDAYTDGRLDDEAYHATLDRVFAARTLGELVPVIEAVGPVPSYQTPAIVGSTGTTKPGELAEIKGPGRAGLVVLGVGAAAVVLLILLLLVLL
ncbi:DUF1707 SHOCT-like domain-containing protein [Raineyella fluvialis]|uniref:DUF1707 domain-containing protein n=1 Tax=Raineyella fluvialis TaxID=2662261 RepID=A0A5Q2F7B5_9ACTN|nr:DUF1707 domain-containing protein [Raineyella fluvialis]QGF22719.1 DUF1707 domain-containing protein [Raineyella fluvialis]